MYERGVDHANSPFNCVKYQQILLNVKNNQGVHQLVNFANLAVFKRERKFNVGGYFQKT